MVNRIVFLIVFMVFISPAVFCQDFEKVGMVRATSTLAVGKPFAVPSLLSYVKGELEYQYEERWSIRGDMYFHVGNSGGVDNKVYDKYHSVLAGVSYHFTKKKQFDPYVGIEAGVLWSEFTPKLEAELFEYAPERSSIDPLASLHAGFNYYATNYFHLFMNVRYLYGIRSGQGDIKNLNEIRLSFGLGFNINVKRKKVI